MTRACAFRRWRSPLPAQLRRVPAGLVLFRDKASNPMIDLDFFFDSYLLNGSILDRAQDLLLTCAPSWSAGAHLFVENEPSVSLDMNHRHSLLIASTNEINSVGPTLRALEEVGPRARRTAGTAELRGADGSLVVFIHADEVPRDGSRWTNQISVQVRRRRVEGKPAAAWCEAFFVELSETKGIVFARAASTNEFQHKNIVSDSTGVRAVGVDFAAGLPGLYWLTAIGRPYLEQLDKDGWLDCPAYRCVALQESVLIRLASGPTRWNTQEYRRTEDITLDWLGRNYFFSKATQANEELSESVKRAVRQTVTAIRARHPQERLAGYALLTDDDLTTLTCMAITVEALAASGAGEALLFSPTDWPDEDEASSFSETRLRLRALAATDSRNHEQVAFASFVRALSDAKAEGLFSPEVFLSVLSTDPSIRLEALEKSSIERLNQPELVEARERFLHKWSR